MRVLVTGSAGHLGEALVRVLAQDPRFEVRGADIKSSDFTTHVGSVADRHFVAQAMRGVDVVLHTATLHKPHVVTHSKEAFVETNVLGTLRLLEAAASIGAKRFVFTSTTSAFGEALRPAPGQPAAWVTEATTPVPKNIYGVTKVAAEDLCQLFHREHGLNCIVLRTSRFFPEEDDSRAVRAAFSDTNAKAIEFLYRRVDLQDVVDAHLLAAQRAPKLGFARYIVSATTPFRSEDAAQLNKNAVTVLRDRVPGFEDAFAMLGWRMFDRLDRVYVNDAARRDLGWQPEFDFERVLRMSLDGEEPRSDLAATVGRKGYHDQEFADGPYPVNE